MQLKGRSFLVGDSVTVADILLTMIQLELQQCILDVNFRNSMAGLNSHFKQITGMSEFTSRMGRVKQGKKQLMFGTQGGEKKEAKVSSKKEK